LLKQILKIKKNKREEDFYFLYMHLIASNGYIINETEEFYFINFKNIFDKHIRLRKFPSSDIFVYNQVFGYKEYDPVVAAFNKNFKIKDSDTINLIDAGSNIGLTSIYFLEKYKNIEIVAIEPEGNNFKSLEYNLSNFNNVKKVNAGIWSRDAKLKIINDFRDKSDWAFRVEESKDDTGLEAFSINSIAKAYNFEFIDILKIDIEGSEKELFTSPNSDLEFLNITKCIALEIHDEFKCREDIYKILSQYGFTFFDVAETTIAINTKLK
jgi:FkbM family methyltransferase